MVSFIDIGILSLSRYYSASQTIVDLTASILVSEQYIIQAYHRPFLGIYCLKLSNPLFSRLNEEIISLVRLFRIADFNENLFLYARYILLYSPMTHDLSVRKSIH